jgi:hypothetical protein
MMLPEEALAWVSPARVENAEKEPSAWRQDLFNTLPRLTPDSPAPVVLPLPRGPVHFGRPIVDLSDPLDPQQLPGSPDFQNERPPFAPENYHRLLHGIDVAFVF